MKLQEFERLFKYDAPGVYDFYVKHMDKSQAGKNRFTRSLIFARELFSAFILKLTPARRTVYFIILFFFLNGFILKDWTYAIASFVLLNFLLAFELADKLIVKDELEVAHNIQMALMPKVIPAMPRYDVAFHCEAAREVGGDFYDFIEVKGTTYFVIGDISGKGMAAALYMVQVQAILHHLVRENDSPHETLLALNQNLQSVLRPDSFLTISLAQIHASGAIDWCRAGHLPLMLYRAADQKCIHITPSGIGVGLRDETAFAKSLQQFSIQPECGDVLVWYTDGIIEAMNDQNEEYGEARLMRSIEALAHRPAQEILNSVVNKISGFCGTTPAHDDMTLIVMRAA
jgi:serine phosphatase RsbU (regulator of sigma subunit)